MAYTQENGIWRTIRGRRVFLESGKSLYASMVRSGRFPELRNKASTLYLPPKEYAHILHELNTWYDSFREQEIAARMIGDFVYVFENYGYDQYRIIHKYSIDRSRRAERRAVFDE